MGGSFVALMLTLSASGSFGYIAEEVVQKGSNLNGIAAIIAASAGMVSALGAVIIGLRSKKNGEGDLEKELLMKLLKEQLEKDDEDQS